MKLPVPPPETDLDSLLKGDREKLARILRASVDPAPGGRYRHWSKLRFLQPPADLSSEEWWLAVKIARGPLLKSLPLIATDGRPFCFGMPDPVLQSLPEIDRNTSGRIEISEQVTSTATRDRYLVSSLIDEAITSSQLEGAATTYKEAKDLLRSGRQPRDRNERMILNNFRAMRFVGTTLRDKDLTPDLILELQREVTLGTLDSPDAAGRLRRPDEAIVIRDVRDETIIHTPPPANELEARLVAFCDFANGKTPDYYVHPVVRSILLHFWLAYDHPFVDGNGRTARALFYWAMLRNGYWLCEYLSISSIVKKSPARYMRAYLYSESDANDATYFVLFHLEVIRLAVRALHEYLRKKMRELRETERLLHRKEGLNHRQLALLSHALRHPDATYSIQSHLGSHAVVYQTARTDLLELAKMDYWSRGRWDVPSISTRLQIS